MECTFYFIIIQKKYITFYSIIFILFNDVDSITITKLNSIRMIIILLIKE